VTSAARPRPVDVAGFRSAWAEVESDWAATVTRASAVAPDLLEARVAGEWSFLETLRHLVFVSDAWCRRALLGRADGFHPWSLPPSEVTVAGLGATPVRASLDDLLRLRSERQAEVCDALAGLTDAMLASGSVRVRGAGYPRAGTYAVRRCVSTLLTEEWEHHRYAVRDLDRLLAG
jgi:hypothetical protein